MNIVTRKLAGLDDFSFCERLQLELAGGWERLVLPTYALVTVERSGGILLGAYDTDSNSQRLCGALIDLVGEVDGHKVGSNLFFGVSPKARNHGIGQSLRREERRLARRAGASLLTWTIDPLRGVDAHIAFNKLGAIGVAYIRNLYGPLSSPADSGLATDRIEVEWWIDSPRANAVLDRGMPPPHYRLGLERMEVATKTRGVGAGMRQLVEFNPAPKSGMILVEIPGDLDRLRAAAPKLARDWRVKTREVFESMLSRGYLISGFVHEAGRSFHLLERKGRNAVLEKGS